MQFRGIAIADDRHRIPLAASELERQYASELERQYASELERQYASELERRIDVSRKMSNVQPKGPFSYSTYEK